MKKTKCFFLLTYLLLFLVIPVTSGCNKEENSSVLEEQFQATDFPYNLSDQAYLDPKGFFKIRPPAGWRIQEFPDDPRGKVVFLGPYGVNLKILTSFVDFSSFEELAEWNKDEIKRIENLGAIDIVPEEITINEIRALRKTYQYRGYKFLVTDFIKGKTAHNLQLSGTPEKYEEYYELAIKSMETYTPIRK